MGHRSDAYSVVFSIIFRQKIAKINDGDSLSV